MSTETAERLSGVREQLDDAVQDLIGVRHGTITVDTPTGTTTGTQHGTYAGWNKHRRQGTEVCVECKRAAREYQRKWRASTDGRARQAGYTKAAHTALQQLKKAHFDEYRRYYEQLVATEVEQGEAS